MILNDTNHLMIRILVPFEKNNSPESKIAPENAWLQDDPFLWVFGLFSSGYVQLWWCNHSRNTSPPRMDATHPSTVASDVAGSDLLCSSRAQYQFAAQCGGDLANPEVQDAGRESILKSLHSGNQNIAGWKIHQE